MLLSGSRRAEIEENLNFLDDPKRGSVKQSVW